MLAERLWEAVAGFAASCVQGHSCCRGKTLPCDARRPDLDKPFGDPGDQRESPELLSECFCSACRGSNRSRCRRSQVRFRNQVDNVKFRYQREVASDAALAH